MINTVSALPNQVLSHPHLSPQVALHSKSFMMRCPTIGLLLVSHVRPISFLRVRMIGSVCFLRMDCVGSICFLPIGLLFEMVAPIEGGQLGCVVGGVELSVSVLEGRTMFESRHFLVLGILWSVILIAVPGVYSTTSGVADSLDFPLDFRNHHLILPLLLPQQLDLVL